MNSGVIIKIEVRMVGGSTFSEIDFIPESAKMKEEPRREPAGLSFLTTIDFKVAMLSEDNDSVLNAINNRKAEFRITDANDTVYLVGSVNYPARLLYNRSADGTPGSFNGYLCVITQISPEGCTIQ
jgi:hypothetical protein